MKPRITASPCSRFIFNNARPIRPTITPRWFRSTAISSTAFSATRLISSCFPVIPGPGRRTSSPTTCPILSFIFVTATDLHGWQAWPFMGREHKGVTSMTNGFGDTNVIGGHDNLFVLWPFFSDSMMDTGGKNPAHQQALIPFYSYYRSQTAQFHQLLLAAGRDPYD